MEDDHRRGSYHAVSRRPMIQARSSTSRTASQHDGGAQLSSAFSPTRHILGKHPISQPFQPTYSDQAYQTQQYDSQNMHSSSPMHGIETHFSYVPDPVRESPIYHTTASHSFSTYTPSPLLPSSQQPTVFETLPPFQFRTTTTAGAGHRAFQVPTYPSTNESNGIFEGSGSNPDLIPGNSLPTANLGTAIRTDIPPSYISLANGYSTDIEHENPVQQREVSDQIGISQDMERYDQDLRRAFEAIIAGRVNDAGHRLLGASKWLLTSVRRLGLQFDNEAEYEHRLSMWREFNHCWEALAQKQKNIVLEEAEVKQRAAEKLDASTITTMVDQLIAWCDDIDAYGLVDYEMGVWEDQIVSAFESCLDIMSATETRSTTSAGRPARRQV